MPGGLEDGVYDHVLDEAGIGKDGRCHFGVAEERIAEPEMLVAVLCHEVAHAWRAVHALATYDREVEERLTDLSTIYLGFGLLTTNGAYRYRQGGEFTGTHAITRWSHARSGRCRTAAYARLNPKAWFAPPAAS